MTTYNLSSRRKPARALLQLGTLLVGACTVGPNYQRAPAPVPVAYKEAAPESGGQTGWRVARPADIYDRGSWWSVYDDPVLDSLERQIDISNQNLKSAEARFRQSEAIVARLGQVSPAAVAKAKAIYE